MTNRGQPTSLWLVSGLTALMPDVTRDLWDAFVDDYVLPLGAEGIRTFGGELDFVGRPKQFATGARMRTTEWLEYLQPKHLVASIDFLNGTRAWSLSQAEDHVAQFAAIVRPFATTTLVSLMNEPGHPSQNPNITLDRLRAWGAQYCGGLIWSVGGPLHIDEPVTLPDGRLEFPGHGGPVCVSHLDRGRVGAANIRRLREFKAIAETHRCHVIDQERLGASRPGHPGQRTWDTTWFWAAGILDICFDLSAVHHSQSGFEFVVPGAHERACADAERAGRELALGLLDNLTHEPRYFNTGHEGSPVAAIPSAIWAATMARTDGRIFCFTVGSTGLGIVLGLPAGATLDIPWQHGWRTVGNAAVRTLADQSTVTVWRIQQ